MSGSLSALTLARAQFAFTISFHIIFPALSIGLASFLAVLEGAWLRTGERLYRDLFAFWSRIFSVGFGMGVVSGVVMSYEFGTNWSGFSNFAGPVTGPLLAYEVLTAFFLEAGFLGVMLFGWNKVGPKAHFAATLMVALGTLVSTFWILASNSWMQTPAGYAIVDGRVMPTDWMKIVFNPSFPYRLVHMAIAAFIASGLLVAATGAWHLLRGRQDPAVRKSFSMALWILLVFTPIQALVGDAHGINTLQYQPAKIAAIEGIWDTESGAGLNLVGVPDMAREQTRYAVSIPHLGSLILTHSWNGTIRGLKTFPARDRPNSLIVFWSFRLMVGLGLLMIALAVAGAWLRRRGQLYDARWFQRCAVLMGPAGFVAILAGWVTTEAGRQPWVVYGVARTADALSPVSAQQVGVSLLVFVIVYFAVFGTGIYYLLKLIRTGPRLGTAPIAPTTPAGTSGQAMSGNDPRRTARRPLSAAGEPIDAT